MNKWEAITAIFVIDIVCTTFIGLPTTAQIIKNEQEIRLMELQMRK